MRKVIFPLAFVGASTLVACSFQMHAGSDPNTAAANSPRTSRRPPNHAGRARAPAEPLQPFDARQAHRPAAGTRRRRRRSTTRPPPTPPLRTGAAIVSGATVFGRQHGRSRGLQGQHLLGRQGHDEAARARVDDAGGYLFTKDDQRRAAGVHVGLPRRRCRRAKRTSRSVTRRRSSSATEADYDFRLVADDGAHPADRRHAHRRQRRREDASPAEKTGPVHLVAGHPPHHGRLPPDDGQRRAPGLLQEGQRRREGLPDEA